MAVQTVKKGMRMCVCVCVCACVWFAVEGGTRGRRRASLEPPGSGFFSFARGDGLFARVLD